MGTSVLITSLTSGWSTSSDPEYFPLASTVMTSSNTEADEQIRYRTAGRLKNLYVRISLNLSGNAATARVRKNGANGNQVVSIPASSTGEFEDAANIDNIVAGDLLVYSFSADATLVRPTILSTLFESEPFTMVKLAINGSNFLPLLNTASTTGYQVPGGRTASNGTATEANVQVRCQSRAFLRDLQVNILTNVRTTDTTFRTRIDTANGNQTFTVAGGGTGIFEDTTNKDAISTGNVFNYSHTTGTGTENLTMELLSVEFVTDDRTFIFVNADTGGKATNGSTNRFLPLGGQLELTNTTESNVQCKARFNFNLRELNVKVISNGSGTASTIRIRKNAANANIVISIPAGNTGLFSDYNNSDYFVSTDEANYLVTAASTVTFGSFSITATGGPGNFKSRERETRMQFSPNYVVGTILRR